MPKALHDRIRELLDHHMGGPSWSIREKAARALAYALHKRDIIGEAEALLDSIEEYPGPQNSLHGRLLCVRYLLTRLGPSLSSALAGTYWSSRYFFHSEAYEDAQLVIDVSR